MLDGYTLKKKRHTKWLSVTESTETSSLWLRASMDDGFACFQISKITALPERVQGGSLTGVHVGIMKASIASVPGEEAGHLGLWHQRWWGGSGSVGTFLLLPQGMQLLSDLLLCFSTQGSTHLRLSLNTCLFLLVTNQNRSERIKSNVVKGARDLESEPIWVLLLLDSVALGWSLSSLVRMSTLPLRDGGYTAVAIKHFQLFNCSRRCTGPKWECFHIHSWLQKMEMV